MLLIRFPIPEVVETVITYSLHWPGTAPSRSAFLWQAPRPYNMMLRETTAQPFLGLDGVFMIGICGEYKILRNHLVQHLQAYCSKGWVQVCKGAEKCIVVLYVKNTLRKWHVCEMVVNQVMKHCCLVCFVEKKHRLYPGCEGLGWENSAPSHQGWGADPIVATSQVTWKQDHFPLGTGWFSLVVMLTWSFC